MGFRVASRGVCYGSRHGVCCKTPFLFLFFILLVSFCLAQDQNQDSQSRQLQEQDPQSGAETAGPPLNVIVPEVQDAKSQTENLPDQNADSNSTLDNEQAENASQADSNLQNQIELPGQDSESVPDINAPDLNVQGLIDVPIVIDLNADRNISADIVLENTVPGRDVNQNADQNSDQNADVKVQNQQDPIQENDLPPVQTDESQNQLPAGQIVDLNFLSDFFSENASRVFDGITEIINVDLFIEDFVRLIDPSSKKKEFVLNETIVNVNGRQAKCIGSACEQVPEQVE